MSTLALLDVMHTIKVLTTEIAHTGIMFVILCNLVYLFYPEQLPMAQFHFLPMRVGGKFIKQNLIIHTPPPITVDNNSQL